MSEELSGFNILTGRIDSLEIAEKAGVNA
jgi:hypothetical protein